VALVKRHQLLVYFVLVYALAALALIVVGLPSLHGGSRPPLTSLLMFPVMVVGVGLIGLGLTALMSGRPGLRELRGRLGRWRVPLRWYGLLFLPPLGILAVLGLLHVLVSPVFTPALLLFGIPAGLLAGFTEEIGWTGFAYPRMSARWGARTGACLLGLLWGLWHFPIVDSLGAGSPHGVWLPAFFAAFIALVSGLRVLIAWVYTNTGSVLLPQLLHASSTGFLVTLGAASVSPAQESLWYALYAAFLWGAGVVAMAHWKTWNLQNDAGVIAEARASDYAMT
jgi:membrane protease YdiL (CAAX protease family)